MLTPIRARFGSTLSVAKPSLDARHVANASRSYGSASSSMLLHPILPLSFTFVGALAGLWNTWQKQETGKSRLR